MRLYTLHCHLRNIFFPNDTDALSIYSDAMNNLIEIDRFGYLNQFSNWNLGQSDNFSDLYSNMSNSDEKFIDIFNETLQNIIDLSNRKNLNVYVCWSGGVDSSAILCGFLMSDIEKSKIKVLYTAESIEEYPLLYNILQKNNITCINLDDDIKAEKLISTVDDGLMITGWCADQLFGSSLNRHYPDYFNKSYVDWLKFKFPNNYNITNQVDQFNQAFNHYKIPVKTFPEWTWFMNFIAKWNWVKFSPYASLGKYSDNVINFFDTIDFQKWSINNFDKLSVLNQANTSEYKIPLKQIIYQYTKDDDYVKSKGKVGSWYYLEQKELTIKIGLIDDDGYKFFSPNRFRPPTMEKPSEYKVLNAFIHNYRKEDTNG